MQIEEVKHYRIALHHLGFRPFFLLGGVFAVMVVAIWLWVLSFQGGLPIARHMGLAQWHAHEMLFGYGLAVIAGFLLTAVRNWTGVQTLHGWPLMFLAAVWLLARIMPLLPHTHNLLSMSVLDILFDSLLCTALLHPLVKTRQWQHLGIWAMVVLLLLANLVFYLGVFNLLADGVRNGLYLALYLVITLIMLMGRRVIPFFIEKGAGYPVTLRNYRWLDISSLLLMLAFIILDVYVSVPMYTALVAIVLSMLHILRLVGWHTRGIWSKPLLWSLYLGYVWLVLGFILKALSYWGGVNPMLAIHAFSYGGVGMMTLGMMARVALGHTGRNVFEPPRILSLLFMLLFVGAVFRVLLPLLLAGSYATWIMLSQWFWIVAFSGFVAVYSPMLVKGRVDGRYG